MGVIFIKLFNMGIQASIAIGVVLIVRELFKLMKVPKKYAYILWVIPLIRLVCPIDIESPFSIMPNMTEINIAESMENIQSEAEISDEIMGEMSLTNASDKYEYANIEEEQSVEVDTHVSGGTVITDETHVLDGQFVTDASQMTDEHEANNAIQQAEVVTDSILQTQTQNIIESNNIVMDYSAYPMNNELTDITVVPVDIQGEDTTAVSKIKPIEIISIVWFVVMVGIVIYSAVTLIILKRKLSVKAPISNDVYAIDCIDTAFVLGISNPKIYVPSYIDEKDLEYVVAHERYHIRRLDYIIKPLAYFIGVLHWYNPIVWLAYHMLVKDMEMSCDEAVLGNLGIDNKKNYAKALLKLSVGRQYALSIPTAFAEGSTKGRVKNIMKIKKPLILVAVIAVAVIGVLGVTLLTNPKEVEDASTVEEKPELACGRYSMVLPEREEEISSMQPPYGEEYIFVPYVEIFEDGSATFCYNPFNEYYPCVEAEYVIEDSVLSMTSELGRTYTFNIQEDGTILFDENNSYDIIIPDENITSSYGFLPETTDKSQFVFEENAASDYMEAYVEMVYAKLEEEYYTAETFQRIIQYEESIVTEEMKLGKDGVVLDYAYDKYVVFHGNAGLFVYDREKCEIVGNIDLATLGLDVNDCAGYVGVDVIDDNETIFFVPIKDGEYITQVLENYIGEEREYEVAYMFNTNNGDLLVGPLEVVCPNPIGNTIAGEMKCDTGLWKDVCYVESDMVYTMFDDEYFGAQAEIQALIEEAEAQAEAAQSNLDALVADSLYQEIISKYSIAVYQGWTVEEMEQEGLCPYADKYSLYDVNMDGVEELLIGKKTPAGIDYDLYDIYTVENGELIQVTDGVETDSYKIYENGIIGYQNEDYSTSNHPIEFANYYLINGVLYDITALGEEEITSWGSSNDNSGFMDAAHVGDYAMIEVEFTRFE